MRENEGDGDDKVGVIGLIQQGQGWRQVSMIVMGSVQLKAPDRRSGCNWWDQWCAKRCFYCCQICKSPNERCIYFFEPAKKGIRLQKCHGTTGSCIAILLKIITVTVCWCDTPEWRQMRASMGSGIENGTLLAKLTPLTPASWMERQLCIWVPAGTVGVTQGASPIVENGYSIRVNASFFWFARTAWVAWERLVVWSGIRKLLPQGHHCVLMCSVSCGSSGSSPTTGILMGWTQFRWEIVLVFYDEFSLPQMFCCWKMVALCAALPAYAAQS